MLDLTLGILTYNAPKTLEKNLNRLFEKKVNCNLNEILLYINPSKFSEHNIEQAEKFNIKYKLASENKWIAPAFKWIVENSQSNTVLLLEDDFFLIEDDNEKIFNILNTSVSFLKENKTDVVRLRSRKNAGNPLYSSWFAGQEEKCMSHLAECVHWRDNPDLDFPKHCQKISENPVWYKFSSKNANFTNNPCIYRKNFYEEYIIPNYCLDFTDIETAATPWWSSQEFNVIAGDGLFCHDRLDGK
jgi:hypothetical protein